MRSLHNYPSIVLPNPSNSGYFSHNLKRQMFAIFNEHIEWADWRSEEEEVVNSVRELTGDGLESFWDEDRFMVRWNDSIFKIPVPFYYWFDGG